MDNPVTSNPNASTATATTVPTVLIVWLAGYFGLDIGAEQAVVVAGVLTTVVLYIGREGIRGMFRRVWRGPQTPAAD